MKVSAEELKDLARWASGAAGHCHVCDEWINEGDDCPDRHWDEYASQVKALLKGEDK